MSTLKLDGPTNILVLLGLTLPELSDQDREKIRAAAAPGSRIQVVSRLDEALEQARDVDIILGFLPEALFQRRARSALGARHCLGRGHVPVSGHARLGGRPDR